MKRFVPLALADVISDARHEADDDAVVTFATEDAEGVGEEFLRRKIRGTDEAGLEHGGIRDARQRKGPRGAALAVEPDEVPEVLPVREVVGLHAAPRGSRPAHTNA